ncbi:homeobox-leucine zipper protein HOX3-like protein [Cinnamomum micranthum f. kanehirae]|uniref:Homeobox-leucine zipper protein HOX3-like protein n=1 Tax=Cinnamomum micranthum f. kanehirae TaxID=337451 RepID=A0A3S3MT23_9MAGN|nr:homeobox-leucine zipper protein HOX3-like protein [Cinnamomum micranthum f. kanehirae]
MGTLPTSSSSNSLELTMAPPASDGVSCMRDLDINQVPSSDADTWAAGIIDEDEDNRTGPPRKKLRLTKEQSRSLEESFRENQTLTPKQKEALALELKLKPRQVEVWFQNRRARTKLKQTEVECEHLKRCFGSLTEENRRLQREVEELRALKVAPPTFLSPHTCEPLPASTLTMCPRCERVTTTTNPSHLASFSSSKSPVLRPTRQPTSAAW